MSDPRPAASHDERLRVPWSWWPVVALIVVLGGLEVGSGFNWEVLTVVMCFLVGFFVVPLLISGRARVQVVGDELRAGGESIRVSKLTTVTALDRQATRLRLGPQADPAARTVVRGWIGPSVMMRLQDPRPTPYWLVSTRRPDQLAAAVTSARHAARAQR